MPAERKWASRYFTVSDSGIVRTVGPAVAVTVSIDVPAGVPEFVVVVIGGVLPSPVLVVATLLHPMHTIRKASNARLAASRWLFTRLNPLRLRSAINSAGIHGIPRISKGTRPGNALLRAVVATFTTTGTAAFPISMADDGDTEQVVPSGAPLQARVTVPLNAVGTICRLNVAVCPALIVVDDVPAVSVKSGLPPGAAAPTPLRVTLPRPPEPSPIVSAAL